jgi:predicted MFS family arabinose efflux permease
MGIAAFLFLYNLFLLDRGFGERSLGALASAVVLGTLIGTLPIGLLAARLGIRPIMITCLLALAAIFALKAYAASFAAQFALDLVGGALVCGWSVCLSPLVANLVDEEMQPRAFSILYATAIVSCGVAGFLGGHVPGWLRYFTSDVLSPLAGKQRALIIFCCIGSLATLPLMALRSGGTHTHKKATFSINRFQVRLFTAVACWSFAVGSFNPFINVFFSHHLGTSLTSLGSLVSVLQCLQAAAVLSTPWVLRRLSLGTGIMVTQLFAAGSLALLAAMPNWMWASLPLLGYLMAQHMSEPGVQTWLMNSTEKQNRSGSSAIYFTVVSGSQAVAAALAGQVCARYGYVPLLLGAACVAVVASLLFRFACTSPEQEAPWAAAAELSG